MEHVDPHIETFDKYLLGLMDEAEREAFERRLENDQDLLKAFGTHRAMVEGIQQHRKTELKNYIREHTQKPARKLRMTWIYLASAAMLSLLAAMYLIIRALDDGPGRTIAHKEEPALAGGTDSIKPDKNVQAAPEIAARTEEKKVPSGAYNFKDKTYKTEDAEIANKAITDDVQEDLKNEAAPPEVIKDAIPERAVTVEEEEPVQTISKSISQDSDRQVEVLEEKASRNTRKKNKFLESDKSRITTEYYTLEEENDMLYQYDGKVLKLYNVNKDEKIYYSTVNNRHYITFGKITYEIQVTAAPVKLVPSDLKLDY